MDVHSALDTQHNMLCTKIICLCSSFLSKCQNNHIECQLVNEKKKDLILNSNFWTTVQKIC